jgi:hypothetical protein
MQFFHFATHTNEFLGRKNGRKLPYFKEMFLKLPVFRLLVLACPKNIEAFQDKYFTSLSGSYLPVAKFG